MKNVIRQETTERMFGLGSKPDASTTVESIKKFAAVPTLIEYVQLNMNLPLLTDDAKDVFSGHIDLLEAPNTRARANSNVVEQVDTSFLMNGILQTSIYLVGVAVQLTASPTCFTCEGEARGEKAVLHYGSADPLRHFTEAYRLQLTFMQRYMLLDEALRDVVSLARETLTSEEQVPTAAYVASANSVFVERSIPKFTPSVPLAKTIAGAPAKSNGPKFRRLTRAAILEQGCPLAVSLVSASPLIHDALLESVRWNPDLRPRVFNAGRIGIKLELYGFELAGGWKKYFADNAKNPSLNELAYVPYSANAL